ncbi:phosphoglycolate phosphatase [Shigella flexneri]
MERALTWARQERELCVKQWGNRPLMTTFRQKNRYVFCVNCSIATMARLPKRDVLFPHVADTLGALQAKGLPLGLVTNKPTPFVAPLLEALDIAKYFSVVIGGDDVQNKKPHPDPLLLVAERMGIAPQQMLFVGDSRNDIQAAKAAGCPSVGLTYGYNYGEAIDLSQPDVIYQFINDLLPALGLPHSENQESKND